MIFFRYHIYKPCVYCYNRFAFCFVNLLFVLFTFCFLLNTFNISYYVLSMFILCKNKSIGFYLKHECIFWHNCEIYIWFYLLIDRFYLWCFDFVSKFIVCTFINKWYVYWITLIAKCISFILQGWQHLVVQIRRS